MIGDEGNFKLSSVNMSIARAVQGVSGRRITCGARLDTTCVVAGLHAGRMAQRAPATSGSLSGRTCPYVGHVYSTCIHCQRALGRNALLETLPVGRRIAFDEAAGRLWVVCRWCSRWNLVPFESRHDAIEASERVFRESRLRMSTGQIGLAKTREGTELVRIGTPLRREMAAWRYAGSLAKRRLRFALTTAPITIGLATVAKSVPGLIALAGPGGLALLGLTVVSGLAVRFTNRRKLATLEVNDVRVDLNRDLVARIRVDASEPPVLRLLLPTIPSRRVGVTTIGSLLGEEEGRVVVGRKLAKDDDEADRLQRYVTAEGDLSPLLRIIMPIVNEAGASQTVISNAADILARYDPDPRYILFGTRKNWSRTTRLTLADANEPRRLALEMLVHEESERRWLAGELKSLEAEWVRASEIASIADDLVRDPVIENRLRELREAGRADIDNGVR